jgi:hypothetical protein
LLAACLLLLAPAAASALTTAVEDFICPLDGTTSSRTVVMSYTVFDQRLDFRPIGALLSPPPVAVCESNGFVLYKEDFSDAEIAALRAIVASDEFKALRAGNGDWFMAGYLAERMGTPPAETHFMYLYASWADEESDPARSARYLALAFERFVLAERVATPGEEDWWIARLMQIEIHRRFGRFEEAERLLAATAAAPEDFGWMLERQQLLVAARDSAVQ